MKQLITSFTLLIVIFFSSCTGKNEPADWKVFIDDQINFAIEQYLLMDKEVEDNLLPRSFQDGKIISTGSQSWVSGFYPGSLWYLYEYSNREDLKEIAHDRTMLIEKEKYNRGTHDLGFMINNSFGNAYRLTKKPEYLEIMAEGAESLISRYNENVGCIRSWDFNDWEFPVIIDNMMNLEYLFIVSELKEKQSYIDQCISHTEKTMKNHYRSDYSSYHLVDYDTITGEVLGKQTWQGYSDESAWARGQSWGLYGFVSLYRFTSEKHYLEHALKIADFLLEHTNLPEDMIPYWDYNAPEIPEALKDASAGAIMASALLELSTYTGTEDSLRCIDAAKTMLYSLGTTYRADNVGTNGNFILKHSVGNLNSDSEVDVPLNYADYYFIEGLLRLNRILNGQPVIK